MFLMTLDLYFSIHQHHRICYVFNENAVIHVFLFALRSSSILRNFLYLMTITEVQVTFGNIYTSDSLVH